MLTVLGLFTAAFLLYLLTFLLLRKQAVQLDRRGLLLCVFAFGIAFRITLLFSTPIQEVDIYRYLWDGRVLLEGTNPYRYSPTEVAGFSIDHDLSEDQRKLVGLRQFPSVGKILDKVHYPEVPTVYPPASQCVFAAAAALTPINQPVFTHVLVMKALLTAFDLGVFALLALLLRRLGQPAELAMLYGWCPLVMKEFANSGHLDAIAVFFSVVTVLLLTTLKVEKSTLSRSASLLASASWGVAVLAKCYPIVLFPVIGSWLWHHHRRWAAVPLGVFFLTIASGYAPFWHSSTSMESTTKVQARDPFEGLRTFLARWEMNDLLFSIVVGNLEPSPQTGTERWYAFVPNTWREGWNHRLAEAVRAISLSPEEMDLPFLMTQAWMGTILVSICLVLAWKAWTDQPSDLPRRVFLCLAWSWYLSATQNPWYWTWALPFLVFVRGPWLWTAGLAMLYYLRFWLVDHYGQSTVPSTGYPGADFFDFVVVWFEHLPVLLLLGWNCMFGAVKGKP